MTELRIILALTVALLALIGYVLIKADFNTNARGCRASGGTWHIPQQSCTWDQP